jgi:hypothetical protein
LQHVDDFLQFIIIIFHIFTFYRQKKKPKKKEKKKKMEKCHRYAISTQSTALQLMFVPRNHAVVICSDIFSHVYGSCCCHMFIVHVERSGAVLPFFP